MRKPSNMEDRDLSKTKTKHTHAHTHTGNAEETGAVQGTEEGLISIINSRMCSCKKKNIQMQKSSEKL